MKVILCFPISIAQNAMILDKRSNDQHGRSQPFTSSNPEKQTMHRECTKLKHLFSLTEFESTLSNGRNTGTTLIYTKNWIVFNKNENPFFLYTPRMCNLVKQLIWLRFIEINSVVPKLKRCFKARLIGNQYWSFKVY